MVSRPRVRDREAERDSAIRCSQEGKPSSKGVVDWRKLTLSSLKEIDSLCSLEKI